MIAAWVAVGVVAYAYAGYPLLLLLLRKVAPSGTLPPSVPPSLPAVSVSLPVYNGEATLAATLVAILTNDYPGAVQVLVISDGSTDLTEEIARSFAGRGVELLSLPTRVGKSEAENRGVEHLRGEVIINTDASVRLDRRAISALVRALGDPTVGVASGYDVSVAGEGTDGSEGENAYVSYEMQVRQWETETGGIVGASGCLYAIRASLHRRRVSPGLSRDFSAALHARAEGYRAVSVPEAICFVPRGRPSGDEYRRKVRTMARGLATLGHHRRLLDPFRYGTFAWKLFSHKLLRWCTPFALVLLVAAFLTPGVGNGWTQALAAAAVLVTFAAWWWPAGRAPRALIVPAYAANAVRAGIHAWWLALTRTAIPVWEPTRRAATSRPGVPPSPEG